MINLIQNNRSELEALCKRFHVRSLDLFGSAADGTFDPTRSDLDFLVEFLPLEPTQPFACYFGLLDGLRVLFGRPVDLVVARAITNSYFLNAVNQSRKVLYAA